MSATLCSELYRQYFGVSAEPIFVSARRFPVTTHFLDDLVAGSEAHIQSVGGDACKRTVVLDGAKAQNLALACGCEGGARHEKYSPGCVFRRHSMRLPCRSSGKLQPMEVRP